MFTFHYRPARLRLQAPPSWCSGSGPWCRRSYSGHSSARLSAVASHLRFPGGRTRTHLGENQDDQWASRGETIRNGTSHAWDWWRTGSELPGQLLKWHFTWRTCTNNEHSRLKKGLKSLIGTEPESWSVDLLVTCGISLVYHLQIKLLMN